MYNILPPVMLVGNWACCTAGKSAKSMARGGKGLPREMEGNPLDLLDAGTSRKMVKHAAARGAAAASAEEEDDFEHGDDGKIIVQVCSFCIVCACEHAGVVPVEVLIASCLVLLYRGDCNDTHTDCSSTVQSSTLDRIKLTLPPCRRGACHLSTWWRCYCSPV